MNDLPEHCPECGADWLINGLDGYREHWTHWREYNCGAQLSRKESGPTETRRSCPKAAAQAAARRHREANGGDIKQTLDRAGGWGAVKAREGAQP